MTTPPPPYGQTPPPSPGDPVSTYPGAVPPAHPPRQPVRWWDVILTIVLLVGLGVAALIASIAGLYLVMAVDSCAAAACDSNLIMLGWLMGLALPWLVLLAAVIVSIVFMVKRKIAFYIPLLGAVGVAGSLLLAFIVTSSGVSSI